MEVMLGMRAGDRSDRQDVGNAGVVGNTRRPYDTGIRNTAVAMTGLCTCMCTGVLRAKQALPKCTASPMSVRAMPSSRE
jgi:hypothetical protein